MLGGITAALLLLTVTGSQSGAEDIHPSVPLEERRDSEHVTRCSNNSRNGQTCNGTRSLANDSPVCPINCNFENNLCGWQQLIQDSFDWTRNSGPTPTDLTGPDQDHTTGAGFYMYIEGNSASYGDSARLLSSPCHYNGPVCLKFWYNMFGSATAMALNIYLLKENRATKVWSAKNNHGPMWRLAQIDISVAAPFQIIVEGIRGANVESDVAIDDISIHSGTCAGGVPAMAFESSVPSASVEVFPSRAVCYTECDFDRNLCSWSQMVTDAFDWTWQSGSTPTPMTGPSADHTGGGRYLYIEASSVTHGDTARLISSECSESGPKCLQFWYHMYGSADTMGLNVYLVQNNLARDVWKNSNDQGNAWHLAEVDFTTTGVFQIIFEGRRGSNDESDVAIDDVTLYSGQCADLAKPTTPSSTTSNPTTTETTTTFTGTAITTQPETTTAEAQPPTTPHPGMTTAGLQPSTTAHPGTTTAVTHRPTTSYPENVCYTECDFDRNLCSWSQMVTDAFDWTWQSGSTPTPMTGPSADHTGGGRYLYIEASSVTHGDTARLISSECSESGPKCLQFWYHMYGSADTMGLNVYLVQNNLARDVWKNSNDQGNAWHLAEVDFTTTGVFQIIFEGRRGSNDESDVAIDDVTLYSGQCADLAKPTTPSSTTSNPTTTETTTETTTAFTDTAITTQPETTTVEAQPPTTPHPGTTTAGLQPSTTAHPGTTTAVTHRPTTAYPENVCYTECDFDRNLCSWSQMVTDAFDWTWQSGPTPTPMTGPSADHTGGGRYLYIEASSVTHGDTARLISSECSESGPKCLQFWYHMYGSADTMGLNVYLVQNNLARDVWKKSNDQGNAWHLAEVDFTTTGVFQIIFEGRRGSNDESDVAIDDVTLYSGQCADLAKPTTPSSTTSNPTTTETTTETTTAFTDTAITTQPETTTPEAQPPTTPHPGTTTAVTHRPTTTQPETTTSVTHPATTAHPGTTAGPQLPTTSHPETTSVTHPPTATYPGTATSEPQPSTTPHPETTAAVTHPPTTSHPETTTAEPQPPTTAHPGTTTVGPQPSTTPYPETTTSVTHPPTTALPETTTAEPQPPTTAHPGTATTGPQPSITPHPETTSSVTHPLTTAHPGTTASVTHPLTTAHPGTTASVTDPLTTAHPGTTITVTHPLTTAHPGTTTSVTHPLTTAHPGTTTSVTHPLTTAHPGTTTSVTHPLTTAHPGTTTLVTHPLTTAHPGTTSVTRPPTTAHPGTTTSVTHPLTTAHPGTTTSVTRPPTTAHPGTTTSVTHPLTTAHPGTTTSVTHPPTTAHPVTSTRPQTSTTVNPGPTTVHPETSTGPQISTTSHPETTAEPQPPTTAYPGTTTVGPQPSTTPDPETTTSVTHPPTTALPETTTAESPPPTTSYPETTVEPQPSTTAHPGPTTDGPQPSTTPHPETTTAVTHPSTTSHPETTTAEPQPSTTAHPGTTTAATETTTAITTPLCPPDSHYSPCAPACSPTCTHLNGPPDCNQNEACEPGCVCNDGFVQKGRVCVPVRECGCVDQNGKKYQFDEEWYTSHCTQKCECEEEDGVGEIECDDKDGCDEDAVCLPNQDGDYYCQTTGFGDCTISRHSKYTSFDDLKYDFKGEHWYVLVKSKNLPQNFQDVYVEGVNAQIHDGGDSSEEDRTSRGGKDDDDDEDSDEQDGHHRLHELKIRVYNHTVEFKKSRRLVVDGRNVRPPVSPSPGLKIYERSSRIHLKSDFGLSVEFDGRGAAEITLPRTYRRKVGGLCGNFDQQRQNDWMKPDGTLAHNVREFGESWRV